MNDCENMLNRSALLQNAINRRNSLHDGSCVKFPYGQRDLDSSITSNSIVNSTTIGNGNNVEDACTDSNDSVSVVSNTSELDNAVNGINGNVNTASNSSDISKELSNCEPLQMVPFSTHPDAISAKKPLCRLDYSVRNTAIGSLPRCNSDLWTLQEQDESDKENDGDDDDDADDDDENNDNGDSDYDNKDVVGNGIWWVLKNKKENNRLDDVKGSETETARERNRRGDDDVCVEREKKNSEKEKNNSSSGDEKSGGESITKEESKAGWQEDGEKRRKWEAIREVKGEGEAEEKKKEEEQEALTPNCYSSNEYEFETASEGIGLLEVKVEKQLCGATVHRPTMLRLTTTASGHDSAPTTVTWSDTCRNQSDTKRLGNNLKKIKETTAMPQRLETEFSTENHCGENVPLVDTVTSQQRVNDPALAALPSPLLPCPPSPALPLATLSSPAPSIPPHSNHPKHPHHHQNCLQQQQNHNQHQQSHAHFFLTSEANLTVSTKPVPSCGNNSPVSTVSASSTSSSSSSSSSPPSPSCPSSPQTTHSSVDQEGKTTKEGDPFHTEVLDSNPDYPTTGHSINDIIKMSLEDYVVLKDEENRRLSVDVLPTANNKPRQSYSKMVLQNILNGTENAMHIYIWTCLYV
uniref:Uncharacterized protein n=1 Tax=Octopus bimaculoides TaxID=37653 RepID=A0A0L8GX10_OCTBM